MKYPDGTEAHIGDRVELWEGNVGVVVSLLIRTNFRKPIPKLSGRNFLDRE